MQRGSARANPRPGRFPTRADLRTNLSKSESGPHEIPREDAHLAACNLVRPSNRPCIGTIELAPGIEMQDAGWGWKSEANLNSLNSNELTLKLKRHDAFPILPPHVLRVCFVPFVLPVRCLYASYRTSPPASPRRKKSPA